MLSLETQYMKDTYYHTYLVTNKLVEAFHN